MSFGVYPDNPCYDAQRPSWMPYWLDTFGENACKWGLYPGADYGTIPNPPAPYIPAPDDPRGDGWTPGDAATGMHDNYIDDVNAGIDAAIGNGTYRPNGSSQVSPVTLAWIGAAAVGAFFLWPMLSGGRRSSRRRR